MKKINYFVCSLIAAATMFSCAEKAMEPQTEAMDASSETRVGNAKQIMVYVETNNVNPLNALTYVKTGTDVPCIDILNIFAANINKDSAGNPSIHFNQELAPIMEHADEDIAPIRATGMKVCLTLLPNWQNMGFANLTGVWTDTSSQVRKFAHMVAYVVWYYGFDGINCDDEYAGYSPTPSSSSTSYGNFILALRAEFDEHFPGEGKLITVFQWGNYKTIANVAGAVNAIDYSDYATYGPTLFGSNGLTGLPNSKFFPVAVKLGETYTASQLTSIKNNARRVVTQGYAGVMGFNLRSACDVNATPVFNAWLQGFANSTATLAEWDGNCYGQRTPFIVGGHTITNANVPASF